MNIGQIIAEADILVPNEVPSADKVVYLNGVNQDFFNVVKIPKVHLFNCTALQSNYILPADVRAKDIDLCMVGMFQHRSMDTKDVKPAQNVYTFDDTSRSLSVYPAPYTALQGVIRYRRVATTVFLSSNLSSSPDAPEEYHFSFIPALAAYLANTQDDSVKAGNYDNQYKAAWNVAAQNYQVGDAM